VMDFPLYVTAKTAKPLGLPLPRKPSLPPAARPKPTPDKIAKDLLPPPSVDAVDDSILALAGNYLNVGKYELAIESYNAVLEDPSVSGRVRRLARLKRGQAYLRRGKTNDIDRALIDYKASGQDGIPMRFRVATTSLKIKAAVTATARRDQSAVVTHIRHDPGMTWYYVKSIDLDKTQRGWVTADAFRDSAKKVVAGSAADPRLNTTTSAPRPSPITVPQALPTTRPNSQLAQSVPSRSAQASTNWNRGSNGSNSSQSHNSRSGSLSGSGINTATWDTAKTQRRQKWANDFQRKNGRAPTVMETPWWENQREMQHNWQSRGMDPRTGKPMSQSRSGGNSGNRRNTMWWRN
ncbi:MAG: tetratricopeptide repeat protein, partial [Planctomycetota bacterium]